MPVNSAGLAQGVWFLGRLSKMKKDFEEWNTDVTNFWFDTGLVYLESGMIPGLDSGVMQVSSRSFAKDLVIPNKRESVSHIVRLDSLDSLRAALLADIESFNHRLDVLLASQLQHGQHLRTVANVAATHFRSIGSKVLGHHCGQRLVWETDVMEFAIDVEGRHVFLNVECVCHISGIEDEVEFELPLLVPVFLTSDDEFFGA